MTGLQAQGCVRGREVRPGISEGGRRGAHTAEGGAEAHGGTPCGPGSWSQGAVPESGPLRGLTPPARRLQCWQAVPWSRTTRGVTGVDLTESHVQGRRGLGMATGALGRRHGPSPSPTKPGVHRRHRPACRASRLSSGVPRARLASLPAPSPGALTHAGPSKEHGGGLRGSRVCQWVRAGFGHHGRAGTSAHQPSYQPRSTPPELRLQTRARTRSEA